MNREQRKDFPPLRDNGNAFPRPLMGSHTGDILAIPNDFTARDRMLTDNGAECAGLANTIATEQRRDLSALDGEGHMTQSLAGPVMQINIFNFQHS